MLASRMIHVKYFLQEEKKISFDHSFHTFEYIENKNSQHHFCFEKGKAIRISRIDYNEEIYERPQCHT